VSSADVRCDEQQELQDRNFFLIFLDAAEEGLIQLSTAYSVAALNFQ